MGGWTLLAFVLLPVLLIVGLYRLMARLTAPRDTHAQGTAAPGEGQKDRLFRDG